MSRVRDPEAKRAALLDAAAAAFADRGFQDTSTGAIARAAGVSEGMVFHHFESKHGLLEALTEREVGSFVDSWLAEADPIDWVAFVDAAFTWVGGHRMVVRIWGEGDDRVIGALRRGMQRGVVPALASAIDAGQSVGRHRVGDAQWFAQSAFAVVGEALIAGAGRGGGPDAAEVARIVAAIVDPD
ncbi:MAG: TetR/AcrR family transcriptional regulator [Actinomycetota bacterium]